MMDFIRRLFGRARKVSTIKEITKADAQAILPFIQVGELTLGVQFSEYDPVCVEMLRDSLLAGETVPTWFRGKLEHLPRYEPFLFSNPCQVKTGTNADPTIAELIRWIMENTKGAWWTGAIHGARDARYYAFFANDLDATHFRLRFG